MIKWSILPFLIASISANGCKSPAHLTTSSGSFTSPYFDFFPAHVYPNLMRCKWTITVAEGKNVKIKLEKGMSIDGGYNPAACSGDWLAMYKLENVPADNYICDRWSNIPMLMDYCPATTAEDTTFVVAGNKFFVEFCTNSYDSGNPEKRGFKLSYEETDDVPTAIPVLPVPVPPPTPAPTIPPPVTPFPSHEPPPKCGGNVVVAMGTPQYINSPKSTLNPGFYPAYSDCTWDITGPTNYHLSFTPVVFDVENKGFGVGAVCFDYVRFDDVPTSGKPAELATVCGNTLFPTLESSENLARVTFKSDGIRQLPGFIIRIDVVSCPANTIQCPKTDINPVCIARARLCDGIPDCIGGRDEHCQKGCGIPPIKPSLPTPTASVNGGVETKPHSWPWQVAIVSEPSITSQLCSGSIIDANWILTAARCCASYRDAPRNYRIRTGDHSRSSVELNEQNYGIDKIFAHPNYNAVSGINDLCLIKTTQPIFFNNHVQPICLVSDMPYPVGKTCIVTGWNGVSLALRQVDVKVSDQDECRTANLPEKIVTDSMLCASNPGKDSCEGDVGGPLVCSTQINPNAWELVGVVGGITSCDKEDAPGIYTRVYSYLGWITNTLIANT